MKTDTTFVSAQRFPAAVDEPRVFFDGTPLPEAEYTQLAFIEVTGRDGSSTGELLQRLTDRAKAIGADAVIGVRKGHRTRTREYVSVADIVPPSADHDPDEDKEEYEASVLTGVAVRYAEPASVPESSAQTGP
ncbi:hypothetical protein [Haliangium sp.]|uniref:hypothetical protein n=1 Tax=Haliangium sp. TaxID=2663208 RepID=UPI003D1245F2